MPQDTPPAAPPLPLKAESEALSANKRWRFSLRAMLIGITAFSFFLGFIVVLPNISGMFVGACWLAGTGWVICGLLFGKGDARAFCIGAAVVLTSAWTGIGGQFLASADNIANEIAMKLESSVTSMTYFRIWFKNLMLLISSIANGWLCIAARRYFERA